MDARLKSLVAAVEAGAICLPINLLVGQWIVQGTPTSSAEFLSRTHHSLGRIAADQLPNRDRRLIDSGKGDHLWTAAMEQTSGFLEPIASDISGAEYAISLFNVTMTGGLSGVVRASTVRVPLASVGAWWIAEFSHEPAKFGGGGGVSVEF